VPFASLPTTPTTQAAPPDLLLADVLGRLASEGFEVLAAELAPPGVQAGGVHAVKVVVPGLEVETVAYGRIGERNTGRLLAAGRDDLVQQRAERPEGPGWAQIHLTREARDRLGGPAWLDRRALDAVAAGLLPLYREPGRHTAQQVIGARAGGAR
jgi:ribosomal protein S12 methylthiotransferase accessory factor